MLEEADRRKSAMLRGGREEQKERATDIDLTPQTEGTGQTEREESLDPKSGTRKLSDGFALSLSFGTGGVREKKKQRRGAQGEAARPLRRNEEEKNEAKDPREKKKNRPNVA